MTTTKESLLRAVGAAWDEAMHGEQAPEGVDVDVHRLADELLRAAGLSPARRVQQRMSADLGPYYDAVGLARRWGVTRQAVSKRCAAGTLLGLPTEDGRTVFPVWQFAAGSDDFPRPLPGLTQVRRVLARRNPDPLSHAVWLTAPTHGPSGRPAHEVMATADGLSLVLAEAEAEVASLRDEPTA